tara:strand:+ start:78 stop:446 length:369 start_codon:yes stop_codon:yes gene_type:complete
MPYKDPIVAREKSKIRSKRQWERDKNKIDYIKRRRTNSWKHAGIKGDYEEIFQLYINQKKCYDCNGIFTDGKKGKNCRATDHHHPSGHFRHIICQGCNTNRGKMDRLRSSICLEIHRHHLLK